MKLFVEKLPLSENTSFVARTHRTPDFEVSWHQHTACELILITEGSGMSLVGNGLGTFTEGDIFLLGADLPHTFQKHHPDMIVSAVVVHFNADFWGTELLQLPESRRIRKLLDNSATGFKVRGEPREQLAPLIRRLETSRDFWRIINLCECLAHLADNQELETLSAPVDRQLNERDRDRINTVYNYALDHFREQVVLAKVAGLANMTEPAFCNYFRKRTRKTYVDFVNELRIGYASKLLLDSDEPVNRVCYESGFNTLAHFNRQFLKIKGMTPTAFRQKMSFA